MICLAIERSNGSSQCGLGTCSASSSAIFFAPRGSLASKSLIRKDIAPKIDAIHAMFKLGVGKAFIDKNHPVGKEYKWPVG